MRVKWERRDNHQNNTVHTDFLFVVLTSSLTGIAPLADPGIGEKGYTYSICFQEWRRITETEDSNCKETDKN